MTGSPVATDLLMSAEASSADLDRAVMGGTLAASMERLARLAVAGSGAGGALITLLGTDRRAFRAGDLSQEWMAHDSGVIVRTGLLARALDDGGLLIINDIAS